ncbi:hypothetical protein LCGC14_2627230 [marine sediment metagenome]|uniref:Uncharacterized protein n=1 Tax=marine sediment metagenome TaxID=412755 RepID=A0A0F9CCE7_9ZZZZ
MPIKINTYGFNKVAAEDLTTEEWREELRKLREGEYPSARSTPVPRSGEEEEKMGIVERFIEEMSDEEFHAIMGKFQARHEKLMDPKETEETYRDVSEEEIEERTAPSEHGPSVENPYLDKKYRAYDPSKLLQEQGLIPEEEKEKRDPSWIERGEPGTFRPLGVNIVKDLVKIANELDKKGFCDEAEIIDDILKEF